MTDNGSGERIPNHPVEAQQEYTDPAHIKNFETANRVLARLGLAQPKTRGLLDRDLLSSDIWLMGEQRRAGLYEDGTPQTNADHVGRVAMFAVIFAVGSNRPELTDDLLEVVLEVLFHDFDESYGKDTPHHDKSLLRTKPIRDKASRLVADHKLKPFEPVRAASESYHERATQIPVFAKAVDAYEPLDFALHTHLATQRSRGDDFIAFVDNAIEGMVGDRTVYPYGRYLLEIIARKWVPWGCHDYNGNPETIIGEIEQEVIERRIQREIMDEDGQLGWELLGTADFDHEPFGAVDMEDIGRLFYESDESDESDPTVY